MGALVHGLRPWRDCTARPETVSSTTSTSACAGCCRSRFWCRWTAGCIAATSPVQPFLGHSDPRAAAAPPRRRRPGRSRRQAGPPAGSKPQIAQLTTGQPSEPPTLLSHTELSRCNAHPCPLLNVNRPQACTERHDDEEACVWLDRRRLVDRRPRRRVRRLGHVWCGARRFTRVAQTGGAALVWTATRERGMR